MAFIVSFSVYTLLSLYFGACFQLFISWSNLAIQVVNQLNYVQGSCLTIINLDQLEVSYSVPNYNYIAGICLLL